MKTKLKHFLLLASFSLASMACGGGLSKPVSGLDVSLLATRMLSISPAPAATNEAVPEPLPATETKTINQTSSVDNQR